MHSTVVPDLIEAILMEQYPSAVLGYLDRFTNKRDFLGWHYHHDATNFYHSPSLSSVCTYDTASLDLQTPAVPGAITWARKEHVIPENATGILFGGFIAWHSEDRNNPQHIALMLDTQKGDKRRYFAVRWVNFQDVKRMRWQVSTSGGETLRWSNVESGIQDLPFNEADKYMFFPVIVEVDLVAGAYKRILANGRDLDPSSIEVGTGEFLPHFTDGVVSIFEIHNRRDQRKEGNMNVSRPFIAFLLG